MDELEETLLLFRGYKIIKIYHCYNCKIWLIQQEKICPSCDVSLKSVNLTSADLLQRRMRTYFKY